MSEALIHAARPFLADAVSLDREGEATRAVEKYMLGIEKLIAGLKLMAEDDSRRSGLKEQLDSYMMRVHKLKCGMKNQSINVEYMETRRILEGSVGHGYEAVFSKVVDKRLTSVHVQDAFIIVHHQVCNFVRFCEFLVGSAPTVKKIVLSTSEDARSNDENFKGLKESLAKRSISFQVFYSKNMHDREIRFDNGWVAKCGRGLDYFKPSPSKYSIGAFDLNLRPCKETNIELFKTK